MFNIQTAETYRICGTYILVRMSGVTKWGKVTKRGYINMEAIESTCNIRKLTRKGQVEEKHMEQSIWTSETKPERKQGSGKWVSMHRTLLCVSRLWKWHKASGKVLEGLGNLRKGLVRL